MTQTSPSIGGTLCPFRQIDYLLPVMPCDRCGQPADRVATTSRTAIDIDLDHPALLLVRVSIHCCRACHHYLRAQPPFLRPDAIYTTRVVRKAVEAVFVDGMAYRLVGQRLARDFWVRPSETIIRRWCHAYQGTLAADGSYQEWVVAEFSGILCVDEVYEHGLALLLAVDPAAPDGDRLVGYQLVREPVAAESVKDFLTRLAATGLAPDEVITDGSTLYPRVIAQVWPQAAHQLCLFHETRHLTRAAQDAIRQVRKSLPTPPPAPPTSYGWGGPLYAQPPSDDPSDPAVQRWHLRQSTRQQGIAQVQALARQGIGQRATARQLGLHRRTVRRWLQEPAQDLPPEGVTLPMPAQPREPSAIVRAQVHELQQQGLSQRAIARATGAPRATLAKWAQQQEAQAGDATSAPGALTGLSSVGATPVSPPVQHDGPMPEPAPPPAPWASWEEVRQVRELLQEHRGVLLRRPEHMGDEERAVAAQLLASPLGSDLTVIRQFLLDWYAMWRDEQGYKRSLGDAEDRYTAWREEPRYAAVPALRRTLAHMTGDRFAPLSQFLRDPRWEATNNGAERGGRAFRHGQQPHFKLQLARRWKAP